MGKRISSVCVEGWTSLLSIVLRLYQHYELLVKSSITVRKINAVVNWNRAVVLGREHMRRTAQGGR